MSRSLVLLLVLPLLRCPPVTAQNAPPRAVSVVAAVARAEAVERRITLQGEVLPLQMTRLTPRATGRIAEVLRPEGSTVEGAEVLVRLDCPDLLADVQIAKALQAEAEAQVQVATDQRAAAQEEREVAAAEVESMRAAEQMAAAALRLAELDLARTEKLHAEAAATLEELERAQLGRERAHANLVATRAATASAAARHTMTRAAISVREAELEARRAGATTATARAGRAAVLRDFASLVNPYPKARITRQLVDPGTLVMANETAVLEVMDVSRVRVRFAVPELDAVYVRAGTPVRLLRADAATDATVTRVTGAVNRRSRAMDAEVELDNGDDRWTPGALCQVEVLVERRDGAVTIPSKGLVQSGGTDAVWVIRNERAHRVPVQLGLDLGHRIEVVDGLTGGERIVVSGSLGLNEGAAVTVTDQDDDS